MNGKALVTALFVIEAVTCLLPTVALLGASAISYLVMLFALPALLIHWQTAGLRTFALITVMLAGGIMGLVAIAMAVRTELLRRGRKRRILALLFACAGLISELLYVQNEGLRNVLSNAFSVWMLAGPIIFGIHLLYRLYSFAPGPVVSEPRHLV